MPADVFAALDEIDMGFMKEQLEAEFSSTSPALPRATEVVVVYPLSFAGLVRDVAVETDNVYPRV